MRLVCLCFDWLQEPQLCCLSHSLTSLFHLHHPKPPLPPTPKRKGRKGHHPRKGTPVMQCCHCPPATGASPAAKMFGGLHP